MKLRFSLFFLFILLFGSTTFAQSLSGKVYSSSKDGLPDVHVILNNGSYTTYTNEDGSYSFENLPSGVFTIYVSSIGYKEFSTSLNISSSTELDIRLIPKVYQSEVAVVTATRTKQAIEDVSIPVSVITEKEVRSTGANTLIDLLQEQAGIALSPNESSAIQIQGFESDYTLVLIDGQPVIGRTRGALNLSRINLANVQQVELVKGPSSALWGSDALAGVINIITKENTQPFSASVFGEYGNRNTYNSGINLGFSKKKLSGQVNASINGSDGFSLSDSTFGNNQNPYTNYAFDTSIDYDFSEYLSTDATYRYARNSFSGPTIATVQGQEIEIEEDGWQDEQSLVLETKWNPFEKFNTSITGYATRYEDYSTTLFEDPNEPDITNNNEQGFNRVEIQNNYTWKFDHVSTLGAGIISEFVNAERYQGKRTQSGSFVYLQHQAFINDKFSITGGARLDNHSTYDSYLSPKLSAKYKPSHWLTVRASVGKGFKAPDFRTLYLNFDNAGSGYRVIGTLNMQKYLNELEQDGRIRRYFINPDRAGSLSPEYSTAYNFGFDLKPAEDLFLKMNFFRNNANNLIEALSIAELTDDSQLYGYVNINEAYTEGVESELTFIPLDDLKLNIGYQYLKAVQIQQDTISVLENGMVVDKAVETESPLSRRPKHSGTVKVSYQEPFWGLETSLRVILRSKYLYNGSQITNNQEYAPGYSIWNFSIAKDLTDRVRFQLGTDNFTNHTDPDYLQYQPGISYYGKLFITLN